MSSTTTTTEARQAELVLSQNPRDALFASLKGKKARIPNLRPVLAGWRGSDECYVSPFIDALRIKVDKRLQSLNVSTKKLRGLQATDFGLFAALWWPEASLDKLEILAYLSIWLFTWDDEIDEAEGLYTDDFVAAQRFRADTLRFVRQCLGLVDAQEEGDVRAPRNQNIQSFDVIGYVIRDAYDLTQKTRFYDEIAKFIHSTEVEQRNRLQGVVPTLIEYWACRLGTSAVYITCAAGEYASATSRATCRQLPPYLMNSAPRRSLWDETNVTISIVNDLCSLKKEMKAGGIDNVVPLAFVCTGDVQAAIDMSMHSLRTSRERFDGAARQLLALADNEGDDVRRQVQDHIEVLRSNCVGNLVWSLQTGRYGLAESRQADGSQQFLL
ncbi:isoprenoid synthase domain-containing protein [Microdochium trichocladiopsis]|uniref:Terpene synthase n=1 Tax=Microdochium trichocladiopsis TaxID=1682393 RepID=A0A9P9BRB2_9PEZI|nr:isoprenoid synthase domain-containing protein [Microdochium trichocladiopsis]KAH7031685.1 isoprenoid synthase domain-containing protein [Microdochium trichocladiopsis]